MKFSHVIASSLIALGMSAFVACDDSGSSAGSDDKSSSSSAPKSSAETASGEPDCSVTDGVVVVSPKKGDTFKMGDKIKVVFGTTVENEDHSILYMVDENSSAYPLMSTAYPAGKIVADGVTCNTVEVELSSDAADPSDEAVIRVEPYQSSRKGAISEPFVVEE